MTAEPLAHDAPSAAPHDAPDPLRPTQSIGVTPPSTSSQDWALDPGLVRRLAARVVATLGAEQVTTVSPRTGQAVGTLPRSTPDDVLRAITTARRAQEAWAARSVRERAGVLRRLAEVVLQRQAEGMDIIQLETGKARLDAFHELSDTVINAHWCARRGPGILRPERRAGLVPGLTAAVEVHHPKGVIGMISPWNYPIVLTINDAIPALLAGNAVVLKPDSQTPFTALWCADVLASAGLPDGLFQVVYGSGSVVGTAIIENTDYICFTGSTKTGKVVAAAAGARLIGCSLELGGKNPVYVADDADLDRAAEGVIRDTFSNTGHACVSMERLILHERIADAFLDRFLDRVRRLRLGTGLDFDSDVGAIANQQQFDILVQHVEDAVANGATVLAGGKPRPDVGPLFFEPTVLENVPQTAACFAEETFGPLAAVYRVSSDEEAVALANDTPYGLNATVWSRSARRSQALARQIKAGTVTVNEAYMVGWATTATPMGGRKESGLGRRHGAQGILRFTDTQSVITQRTAAIAMAVGRGGESYSSMFTFISRLSRATRFPWP